MVSKRRGLINPSHSMLGFWLAWFYADSHMLLQVHKYGCLVRSRRNYYNMVLPSLWFSPSSYLLFCDSPWVLGVRVILLVHFVIEPSIVTYSLSLNQLWASVLTIHCMISLLWWGFLYSPQLRHGNSLHVWQLMNRQGKYGASIQ